MRKIGYIDLMDIQDPKGVAKVGGRTDAFYAPSRRLRNVDVVDYRHIVIANDNNTPYSSGRRQGRNGDEFVLLHVPVVPNAALQTRGLTQRGNTWSARRPGHNRCAETQAGAMIGAPLFHAADMSNLAEQIREALSDVALQRLKPALIGGLAVVAPGCAVPPKRGFL
ncbi:MAG: hypothetical protein IPO43_15375 [Rhodoferax sp.]|nr:hypothetical protein [Rhodoferax sp.]